MSLFLIALFVSYTAAQSCWYSSAACTANGINGFCGDSSNSTCCSGGAYTSGLCPGTASIQCCTSPRCSTPSGAGTCVGTAQCSGGTSYSGYCTGPSNVQCCVKGTGASNYGVDVSVLTSTANWTCMKNNGYNWGIVRAFRSTGAVDTNACASLQNAKSAGIGARDAYIFPCPTCAASGASQVTTTVNNLKACSGTPWSGFLWLDIEGTTYWSTSTTTNRQFFESMVSGCTSTGIKCGVYTANTQWNPIMGTYNGGSSMRLWYPRYQNPPQPNFNEYVAFGGWNTPFAKQYVGDTTLCGVGADLNWTPNNP